MEDFVSYELSVKLKEKGFVLNYNLYGYKPIYTDINIIALIWNNGAYEKDYFINNFYTVLFYGTDPDYSLDYIYRYNRS